MLTAAALVSCTTESFETLKQACVVISDVDANSTSTISATFTPDSNSDRYIYAIGSANDREAFLSGEFEGITPATSAMDVTFDNLDANTSYTIYACAYDAEGVAGSLASVNVRTSDAICNVELLYQGATSAGVSMAMSSTIYQVDYALSTPGRSEEFKSGDMEEIKSMSELFSKTVNYFDLEEDSAYTFYYQYYDRKGNVSKIYEVAINTGNKESVPYVELTKGDVNIYTGDYTFTPNDLCKSYHFLVGAEGEYSHIYDSDTGYAGDIFSMILNWAGEDWGVYSASKEHSFALLTSELYSSADMEFYVVACDGRNNPRALQRFSFSTPKGEATGTAEIVSIVEEDVTDYSAKFTITPNKHTFGTFYSLFTKYTYDSYWALYPEELEAKFLEDYYNQVYYGESVVWVMGNEPFIYEEEYGLAAGTTYYVVAMPMNGAGLDIEGCIGAPKTYEFTTDSI